MKLYAQIINGKIIPEHDSDKEKLSKLSSGVTYRFEVVKERNYQFHKKLFALLNLAYMNQDTFNNFEDMRSWAIMKAGYYRRISTPSNDLFLPESISFASMDGVEFEKLYSSVMDVICNWLDITDTDIEEQIINFM